MYSEMHFVSLQLKFAWQPYAPNSSTAATSIAHSITAGEERIREPFPF